jgi:signal transduction histidine kinase
MPAHDRAARRRKPRYRRRLRTRLILSFLVLGFSLTSLFAFAAIWASKYIENQMVEDVMNRNIAEMAREYARNPGARPVLAVEQMYARAVNPRDPASLARLQRDFPGWAAMSDGIQPFRGTDENNNPLSYKVAVRKTPDAWFFLAYDTHRVDLGQKRLRLWLMLGVTVFAGLSLVLGWWSASRVMSPVSELAQRLRDSGRSSQPEALAAHFPDDEVGELAKALDDYSSRLTDVVKRDREFNADVSHELRTPLAVIKGAVELSLSRPDLDDKTRSRLQRIQRAEAQCTDLISALLLLSRNERGSGSTDVGKVAEQLLDAHRAQLGGKPLELRLEGGIEQRVDAPESAINVALGNLVGNAVKYTPSGEVVVRLLPGGVEVSDTGPGLSAEDAARLFERGYRGTHAEHSQGGGIGLSIVRRLCELYGWSVQVRPGATRGVVATLRFSPAA